MHDKAQKRLALGGFKLRKWVTNRDEPREKVQQCDLRDSAKLNDKTKSASKFMQKKCWEENKERKTNGFSGYHKIAQRFVYFQVVSTRKKGRLAIVRKRSILKIAAGDV